MNIKQARQHLEPLARTPAQQEALDTLYWLAVERDNALHQAEREHKRNEKLHGALNAMVEVTQHMKPCPGTLDDAHKALAKARGEA